MHAYTGTIDRAASKRLGLDLSYFRLGAFQTRPLDVNLLLAPALENLLRRTKVLAPHNIAENVLF